MKGFEKERGYLRYALDHSMGNITTSVQTLAALIDEIDRLQDEVIRLSWFESNALDATADPYDDQNACRYCFWGRRAGHWSECPYDKPVAHGRPLFLKPRPADNTEPNQVVDEGTKEETPHQGEP